MATVKLIAAIVSSFIFCSIASWLDYTPVGERDEGVYYYSYFSLWGFGMLYMTPMFIGLGVPVACYIDNIVRRLKHYPFYLKYLTAVILYAVGGLLAMLLLMLVFTRGNAAEVALDGLLWASVLASMLLLHVSILIDVGLRSIRRRIKR